MMDFFIVRGPAGVGFTVKGGNPGIVSAVEV